MGFIRNFCRIGYPRNGITGHEMNVALKLYCDGKRVCGGAPKVGGTYMALILLEGRKRSFCCANASTCLRNVTCSRSIDATFQYCWMALSLSVSRRQGLVFNWIHIILILREVDNTKCQYCGAVAHRSTLQ